MFKGVVTLLAEVPKQAFGHAGAVAFDDCTGPIRTRRIQDVDITTPGQGFEATWLVLFFIFGEDVGGGYAVVRNFLQRFTYES